MNEPAGATLRCPQCGAPYEPGATDHCPFCNALLPAPHTEVVTKIQAPGAVSMIVRGYAAMGCVFVVFVPFLLAIRLFGTGIGPLFPIWGMVSLLTYLQLMNKYVFKVKQQPSDAAGPTYRITRPGQDEGPGHLIDD